MLLVCRYSVLSALGFELSSAAPVDVLHCVYLGLVRMEVKLFAKELKSEAFKTFKKNWLAQRTAVPLPSIGDDGQHVFCKTLRADQLVSSRRTGEGGEEAPQAFELDYSFPRFRLVLRH